MDPSASPPPLPTAAETSLPGDAASPDALQPKRKRIFGCLALVVLLLLVLGVASYLAANFLVGISDGATAVREAGVHLQARDYPATIDFADQALAKPLAKNNRALVYADRGGAHAGLGHDAEAIKDFDRALALAPKWTTILLSRGLALHRLGQFDRALADYDKVLLVAPHSLDALLGRARILAHRGRYLEAIADMKTAVQTDPRNPGRLIERGNDYLLAGDLKSAQASFESALQIDPKNGDAYLGEANVCYRQGNPSRGRAILTEAVERYPQSAWLYYLRGLFQFDAMRWKEWLDDFDSAIALRKNYTAAYAERGAVESWRGDYASALADLIRAIQINPRSSEAHYVRGRIYVRQRKYRDALGEFNRAVADNAESASAVAQRALTKAALGDFATARRELAAGVREFAGGHNLHDAYAWFLATCPQAAFRNGALALSEARLGARDSYGSPIELEILAAAYAETGDFAHAVQCEGDAAKQLPENVPDRKKMDERLAGYRAGKPYRDNP